MHLKWISESGLARISLPGFRLNSPVFRCFRNLVINLLLIIVNARCKLSYRFEASLRLQQRLLLDVGNPRLRNFLVMHNKVTVYHQSAVTVQNTLPNWQTIIETQIQWFQYKNHHFVIHNLMYPWNHKILHAKALKNLLYDPFSIKPLVCSVRISTWAYSTTASCFQPLKTAELFFLHSASLSHDVIGDCTAA